MIDAPECRRNMRAAALNWQDARLAAHLAPTAEDRRGWQFVAGFWLRQAADWRALAADLAVTPEALYRELARRR